MSFFLERTLRVIGDEERPLSFARLYDLSGLSVEELRLLAGRWLTIGVERRRQIVRALVEIAEESFEVDFEGIFYLGLDDPDAEVRAAAVDGLWEIEEIPLADRFIAMLQHDPSPLVRAAAAIALGRFMLLGELEEIGPEPRQRVYQALRRAYTAPHEDLEVRRRALESIAYAGEPEVADFLAEAYRHEAEAMRISAVFGMGRSADTRWAPIVMRELYSPNPAMRYEAARACGELELTDAVPMLAELLEDVDREVEEAALWALGQIGGDEARELLLKALDEGDEVTQAAAEAALDELEFMHGVLDFPLLFLDELRDNGAE